MSTSTPPRPEGKAATPRVRRVNFRALAILAIITVLGLGTVAAVAWFRPPGGSNALAEARQLLKDGKPDLALSYLNAALKKNPRNADALDLKAQLLTDSAHSRDDYEQAIKLGDLALLQNPPEELAKKIRRRQVNLTLGLHRFQTASALVDAMLKDAPEDPEVLQLAAMVQEGMAQAKTPGAVDRALELYRRVLAAEPGNLAASLRMAGLLLEQKDQPEACLKILDDLAQANPESAIAQLARNRYFAEFARRAEAVRGPVAGRDAEAWFADADAALDEALKLEPDNAEVRLAAADYCLKRDRPEAARAHLDTLSKEAQENPRALDLKGLSYAQQNRPDLAIADWRSGLLASHGTDADLTWRLAIFQLKLGRVAEAEPLVEQYRRLGGVEEPTPQYLYLVGLRQLKQNKAPQAIATLEKARSLRVPPELQAELYYTLGQAHEATRNQVAALERYDDAILADPSLPAPRLARIRLLQQMRPAQAKAELERAVKTLGDVPALIVAQARDAFRAQLVKPADQRDWSEVEALVDRAAKAAPASPELVRIQSDLILARDGAAKLDEALALLERATAIQPNDAQLWLARVERLEQANRPDQALLVLEQAMAPEAAGDQAGFRIARARILTSRGRGQEARDGLTLDLDRLPPDQRPAVWAALGDLYTAQRNPGEARRAYQQWANLLPADPVPRLFLLDLALAQNDPKAADEQVQKLKQLTEGQGIYWRIARTHELFRKVPGEDDAQRASRLAEAEEIINQIEKDAPEQRYAPMLRGQLLEIRGKKAEAAESFAKALKLDGGQSAIGRLVSLYTELGQPEKLEELRKQFGAEVPSLDRALAEEAFRQGDKARAETLAARFVESRPDDLDARVWQARLLNTLGKGDQAIAVLRDAVRKKPEALNPRLALLYFLTGLDQDDQAAAAVEDLIKNVKDLDRPELTYAQAWRIIGQAEKADAAYKAALARWPDDPRVIRAAADHYESTSRAALAEQTLRDALKAHADWRWAARALAMLRSNHPGEPDAWREALALVQAADPGEADSPEERLARGIVLARSTDPKDREQATATLDQLVLDLPADYPSSAAARAVLEALHIQAQRFDKAAAVAAVNAGAPNANAQAVARYAELLIAAKQFDQARTQLDRLDGLLAPKPQDITAVLLRARMLVAQNATAEAVSLLREAFDARREIPEATAVGRRILAAVLEVDPATGEEIARQIAETKPELRWLVAAALARQDRRDETLAMLKDVVDTADPANLPEIGQIALGLATENGMPLGDDQLAEVQPIIDAAVARDPKNPSLLTLQGYLRHFQRKYDQEIAIYQEALKAKPDEPAFLNNLAWSLSEGLGKPQEALPIIERAIALAKTPLPQFLDTRGVIHTRLGQLDQAIHDLELAVQNRPSATTLAHLARAYHKAGQLDKFQKARQQALDLKLTPEQLEPTDRADLVPLIFGDDAQAPRP